MVRGGRALCGSPSPTPCPSRVTQSRGHSTTSRWGWNISREGDSQHHGSYRAAGTGSPRQSPPYLNPNPRTGCLHPPEGSRHNRPQVWGPRRGGCHGTAEQAAPRHGGRQRAPGAAFCHSIEQKCETSGLGGLLYSPQVTSSCIVSALLGFTSPWPAAPKMDYWRSAVTRPLLRCFSCTWVLWRNPFSSRDKSSRHVSDIITV